MLFIHKETGEIIEILVTALRDAMVLPIGHAFPIGSIVCLGNYQGTEDSINDFNKEFEFLGFLWFLQKKQAQ